eukprot:5549489-Ditylum_brightwellii.AAC.1
MEFAHQNYVQHFPDKGKTTSDNLSGPQKNQKKEGTPVSAMVNLAQVQLDWTKGKPMYHAAEEEHFSTK